jgi:hypothetical protein
MQVKTFLEHYSIRENPFRAEEARHDVVFGRIETACRHPDFEKICGDFEYPSTSVVCGERGSGKTAIRLQIEHAIEKHNQQNPARRCLVIAYDDLNPILDRFSRHVRASSADEALKRLRLTDHMDAMLASIVPALVDQALGELRGKPAPLMAGEGSGPRRLHQLDVPTKRDLLMMQVCYDHADVAGPRTARLRRALRYRSFNMLGPLKWGALVAGGLTLAVMVYLLLAPPARAVLWHILAIVLALTTVALGARYLWLWYKTQRLARALSRHVRVVDRPATSFRESLLALATDDVLAADLPSHQGDEPRYAMLERLRQVIRPHGYVSIVILVDRVDEPTLISGKPRRMQALVWPLLNSKFLQQESIGLKLLLPLELRYLLGREGEGFFREARLDKQNYIDHLAWSGATLYDVCTARLNACRAAGDPPMTLADLFETSVGRRELVDVLDQMQQPRDAFKFLYQLIQEHCANAPEDSPEWKIARATLDGVRKHQSERLSAMLRGMAPA